MLWQAAVLVTGAHLVTSQNQECTQDEFTCLSGSCVPLPLRCDSQSHCTDSSDELNCTLLSTHSSHFAAYNKLQPPSNLQIRASVVVEKILKIDSANMFVELKFNLILEWFDHKVKFLNLQNKTLNVLSPEEIKKLWMPKVLFQNSDNIEPIYTDSSSFISVRREGEGQSSELGGQRALVFSSSSSPLVYQRKYQQRFYCTFYFHWFPFDTQECGIELVNFDTLQDVSSLAGGYMQYTGPQELLQYTVTGWRIEATDKPRDKVVAVLQLQRLYSAHLFTTFIPACCLLMVSYSTLFFKSEHFKTSVPVVITTLLVTFTLYTRVASTLPSTSYVKAIEVYLLFHIMLPFIIFLILFRLEHPEFCLGGTFRVSPAKAKEGPLADVNSRQEPGGRGQGADQESGDRGRGQGALVICALWILPIVIMSFFVVFFMTCLVYYYY